ncbi:MAG: ABC transporter permease [Proteobacteria bacterium]|nr:ABC transporter permease [Pseudomonadota bacterium]
MFKNYVLTAWRNTVRHKLYSLITIGGLAIGLAATVLILLFVYKETSYDTWVPNAERIYRLHTTYNIPGRDALRSVRSSGPMRQAFQDNFEQVESATRLGYLTPRVFKDGAVYDQQITFVDPEFFEVFDLPLLQGDRATALADPRSLILSESTARKYFGDASPLGQTLTLCCFSPGGESTDYQITGVIADTPENAHFEFSVIGLIDGNVAGFYESWTSINNYTYFKLKEGSSPDEISDRLPWFLDNVFPVTDQFSAEFGLAMSEATELSLMPIRDIHLGAKFQAGDMGDIRPLGERTLVIEFLLIAFLILGIATINFINLATARFMHRAREVSMRKVLGASRRQITQQFLGEAVLASLFASILALGLVELMLPWYNKLLSTNLTLQLFGSEGVLAELILMALVAGLVGGMYPALYVSKMHPVKILKANQSSETEGASRLKSLLVVFQFAISIALITATAVIYVQTDYAKSVDLGYERDNHLVLRNLRRSGAQEMKAALEARIQQIPEVINVVLSSDVPTDNDENNTFFSVVGRGKDAGRQLINHITIDYDFLEVYGIEPLYGRTFSESFGSDTMSQPDTDSVATGAAILNVSAAKRLGFDNPGDAIGEVLATELFWDSALMEVVGVIPDISFRSAHFEDLPLVYFRFEPRFDDMTILYSSNDPGPLIAEIETIWKELIPSVPFSYAILDDLISAQYLDEDRQFITFSVFALLAVFISGLGLFALAAFTADRRTKEIGVRKVFGASVRQIVQMLTWQFSKPVVWANLIAWPVAWYFLNDWLSGFVYRIGLSPTYFVFAGMIALAIAWATVAGHAWRVARKNPIRALRYE